MLRRRLEHGERASRVAVCFGRDQHARVFVDVEIQSTQTAIRIGKRTLDQ
jgi:hypothetical protein